MSNNNGQRMTADELRREAERRLHERQSAQAATLSEAELRALVNELQVRQIELELQNEELQRAPAAADTSKGKQMERLLRESEERSRLLMDSIPAYISYVDADERYRWVNRAYELYFCRPLHDIIGRTIAEIQKESQYRNMQPYIRQALAGRTVHYENKVTNPQGALQTFDTNYIPHVADDGTILGFIVLVFDITEMRQAIQRQQDGEARTRAILETAVDAIVTIDERGMIESINPETEKLFGYTAEELIGRNVKYLMPSPFQEEHDGYLKNYLDTSIKKIIGIGREVTGLRKDGTTFPMHLAVSELWLGTRRMFTGIVRDITELRQAIQRLQDGEARTRAILETAVDAIITIDEQGLIESLNPAAEQLFGYMSSELIGNNVKLLMPSPYQEEHDKYLQNYLTTGNKKIIGSGREVIGLRKDGTTFPMDLAVSEVPLGNRRLFTGIVRDISERRNAEDALRESGHRYRTFIDTCTDSVFLLDLSGNIRSANPAAVRMHGYTLDELLKMNIRDLDVPADIQLVPERLRSIQSGDSLRFETIHLRKDGTSFPIDVHATPVNIGNDTFILAFDRDISERKRSEDQTSLLREELAYTSRLVTLREMASGLAHELNQPLAAMSLYAGSAVELAAQYNSAELNECMRRITEQLQHTGEIIRSMRTFAGRGSARREFININLLIEDVLTLLAGELKRSDTIITLQLHTPMYPVFAQGVQIKQVLVNLIRNALEEMTANEGGERKLVIRTEFQQKEVRVSVADTGPGLDPAIANRLFLPFQTTKPDGLGMGLAICRTLIEAQGGRIGFESSPDNGTTFYFVLPRSTETQ